MPYTTTTMSAAAAAVVAANTHLVATQGPPVSLAAPPPTEPLPHTYDPSPNDVICHNVHRNHPGNVQFHQRVLAVCHHHHNQMSAANMIVSELMPFVEVEFKHFLVRSANDQHWCRLLAIPKRAVIAHAVQQVLAHCNSAVKGAPIPLFPEPTKAPPPTRPIKSATATTTSNGVGPKSPPHKKPHNIFHPKSVQQQELSDQSFQNLPFAPNALSVQEFDHDVKEALNLDLLLFTAEQATAHDARAQCKMGHFLRHGVGFEEVDYVVAADWYTAAARHGNDAVAQYCLANCYRLGQGVPQDQTKAAQLLQVSANQGMRHASDLLGVYFAKGWGGLPRNLQKAAEAFGRAASSGLKGAKMHLSQLLTLLEKPQKLGNKEADRIVTYCASKEFKKAMKAWAQRTQDLGMEEDEDEALFEAPVAAKPVAAAPPPKPKPPPLPAMDEKQLREELQLAELAKVKNDLLKTLQPKVWKLCKTICMGKAGKKQKGTRRSSSGAQSPKKLPPPPSSVPLPAQVDPKVYALASRFSSREQLDATAAYAQSLVDMDYSGNDVAQVQEICRAEASLPMLQELQSQDEFNVLLRLKEQLELQRTKLNRKRDLNYRFKNVNVLNNMQKQVDEEEQSVLLHVTQTLFRNRPAQTAAAKHKQGPFVSDVLHDGDLKPQSDVPPEPPASPTKPATYFYHRPKKRTKEPDTLEPSVFATDVEEISVPKAAAATKEEATQTAVSKEEQTQKQEINGKSEAAQENGKTTHTDHMRIELGEHETLETETKENEPTANTSPLTKTAVSQSNLSANPKEPKEVVVIDSETKKDGEIVESNITLPVSVEKLATQVTEEEAEEGPPPPKRPLENGHVPEPAAKKAKVVSDDDPSSSMLDQTPPSHPTGEQNGVAGGDGLPSKVAPSSEETTAAPSNQPDTIPTNDADKQNGVAGGDDTASKKNPHKETASKKKRKRSAQGTADKEKGVPTEDGAVSTKNPSKEAAPKKKKRKDSRKLKKKSLTKQNSDLKAKVKTTAEPKKPVAGPKKRAVGKNSSKKLGLIRAKASGHQKFKQGTRIVKEFWDQNTNSYQPFEGTIVSFERTEKGNLYLARYSDGDEEHLTEKGVQQLLDAAHRNEEVIAVDDTQDAAVDANTKPGLDAGDNVDTSSENLFLS